MTDVLAESPEEPFTQKLVPERVGIDAEGRATPALTKKMASLGIACDVADLKRVDDGKERSARLRRRPSGRRVGGCLQTALDDAVRALPIPKVMTYQLADGVTTVAFVRPVKHLTALFGADVVPSSSSGSTPAASRWATASSRRAKSRSRTPTPTPKRCAPRT